MPVEMFTPCTEMCPQKTILKVGISFDKYDKDKRKKLYDEIKEQVEEHYLIPILVPEDVSLETVYI